MRKFEGFVHMKFIEFEVEDNATDLDIEKAFNEAILEKYYDGFDSTVEYEYEEVG